MRQCERIDRIVFQHDLDTADARRRSRARCAVAGQDGDILPAVDRIGDRARLDGPAEHGFPEHLAVVGVERPEAPRHVAPEKQIASRHERRAVAGCGL